MYKKVTISSTDTFELKLLKFIYEQKLKGIKTNRSELYRDAIELYIKNGLRINKDK